MSVFHGGDVWQGGRPGDYMDFSANLNPEGPPEWVRAAMLAGLSDAAYYPDARQAAALAGMAAHLQIPEDCLLLTGGGIEAIGIAADLAGGAHVIPQPTFQEYGNLCRDFRAVWRDRLDEYVPAPGDCLWLCNPNNPTGDALPREKVLKLLARMEAVGGRLVVDEAFIDYCPKNSVLDCVTEHPALVVLGSMTKALAIPGVRLGWLAAHPSVVARARERALPWRLNCVAAAVAAALPDHGEDFDRIRSLNEARRERFARALTDLGARVYPSDANFLLCDFGRDMRPAVARLRDKKILLRPCHMFPGLTPGHIRLCVRTEGENQTLAEAVNA